MVKSSLQLKTQLQNTPKLQLFRKVIKTDKYLQKLFKMPSRQLGFRDQVVQLKRVKKCEHFKVEKLDLSRECLIGVNIQSKYKSLSET